jgi:dolichyl-phosphate beta-glucosyltransferase
LKIKYEIILVNDGSKDKTWEIMQNLLKKYKTNNIYAINYGKNAGKGHAVMTGFKYTKGKYILMLDADGATETSDYQKLRKELDSIKDEEEDLGITIGSRAHLIEEEETKIEVIYYIINIENSIKKISWNGK